MTEAVDYRQQYQNLSPIERNRELKELAQGFNNAGLGDSAVLGILVDRLKALLDLAPITPHFEKFISSTLATDAVIRTFTSVQIEKPKEISGADFWFIDQDGPGIFVTQTAMPFDQEGYKIMIGNLLNLRSSLNATARDLDAPEDALDSMLRTPFIQTIVNDTRLWRQEFIDKYKQEP